MDNCMFCHKPIEDLPEGDIPYHVECAIEHIRKVQKLAGLIKKADTSKETPIVFKK